MKYQQAKRKGKAWPGIYLWAVLFLFAEGTLHYIFVMEYDILMSYGITAVIAAFILQGGDLLITRTTSWGQWRVSANKRFTSLNQDSWNGD